MRKITIILTTTIILVLVYGVLFASLDRNGIGIDEFMAKSSFEARELSITDIPSGTKVELKKGGKPPRDGWFEDDEATFYYVKRKKQIGWMEIGEDLYHFDEEGRMSRGWVDDQGRYYLDPVNGAKLYGIQEIGDESYYLDPETGALVRGQWLVQDGKEYYVTTDGSLAKGKTSTFGGDYYFNKETGELIADLAKPVMVLGFDDGPGERSMELLDTLRKHNVKASFFFLGNRVAESPEVVKMVYEEGHSVGSHSYDHPYFTSLNDEEIRWQIEKTDEAIEEIIGEKAKWFRTPYGETTEHIAGLIGKPTIHWNIDSEDWKEYSAEEIRDEISNYAMDGGIVLVHDSLSTTVEAMEMVIPLLKEEGYQLVNLELLFDIKGIVPKKDQVYRGLD